MLLSGLLSIPLIIWFQIAKWVLPAPSNLTALVFLAIGGMYLLVIQVLLLWSAMRN
jgi:hypothetical protein